MNLNSLKSKLTGKKETENQGRSGNTRSGGTHSKGAAAGGGGARSKGAAGSAGGKGQGADSKARGADAKRHASDGKGKDGKGHAADIKGKDGKIAPVSPSRARLEKRANDEKIIRTIKIIFTSIVTIAIIGIIVSIVLYVYKPTVATVGNVGIAQYEMVYNLKLAAMYGNEYTTTDTMARQALNGAAETKIMEVIAKEKGITISPEDKENHEYQLEYIKQLADSESSGGARLSVDDYLRNNLGITRSQYRKILESSQYGYNLYDHEFALLTVTDDEALAAYDENVDSYERAAVRHILFFYEGNDEEFPRSVEESEALALQTIARINAGEDMIDLVMELSEDGDLSNEGLYEFSKGDSYEPGFVEWTFDHVNQIGDVGLCETSYGFHVMRLEDRYVTSFDEAKDEIIYDIKSAQLEQIMEAWKGEARFQIQTNERVFDTVVKEVFG